MQFEIIFANDEVMDYFHCNIFNLKHDFKKIGIKYNDSSIETQLAEEIHAELKRGPGRPAYEELEIKILSLKGVKHKITSSKIRTSINDNKSKSNQLRCIIIVDNFHNRCIVLHIFLKKHKSNITKQEKNSLSKCLDIYYQDLKKELNI